MELVDIEVPPLINGSRPMDSSVRQIVSKPDIRDDKDHWMQRPDGEQINVEVVEGNSYPGDEQTGGIVSKAQSAIRKRFSIEYTIKASGGIQGGGKNEYVIHEYQKNTCGTYCRNDHNPTPEKSLNMSYVLARLNNYPAYYENVGAKNVGYREEGCVEPLTEYNMSIQGEKIIACTLDPEKVKVIVTGHIPDEDGNAPKDTASIVVIMESPWGVEKICEEGEGGPCIVEYNEVRNNKNTIPGENEKENFYVLTSCRVHIEGVTPDPRVQCAWDVNHLGEEVEFQSNDNIPGEVYPDKDSYIRYQVKKAEERTDEVYEM
jgi:hypothetical protein